MKNCIFCKIIEKEIPCEKVYEDKDIFAFLDINPVNVGHTLVIPKKHFTDIHETPSKIMGKIMGVAKKVSTAIKKAVNADGINIHMNNEEAAFQAVFHTHIHVIPRFINDGFHEWNGKKIYNKEEGKITAEKIKKEIK